MSLRPTNTADVVDAVIATERLNLVGSNSKARFRIPVEPARITLDLSALTGIVDFSPNDQVVSVRAGTRISDLQTALAESRQCIPVGDPMGTVAGALSLNLPHALEGVCGSWRDWVLGMTLVQADGTVAKSGSHAVKNVAGYDLHKLAIGARGTMWVIAEVILKTFPIRSLPEIGPCPSLITGHATWMQRTLPQDFAAASRIGEGGWNDVGSSTRSEEPHV